MRPIHLSIAGLHSFREKQEIDFETLCAGGVFGIFGPTGSGKSTILDAITLALYGKVERATNNTQGIMNHAEDSLRVSFTFQLGKKEVKRYRVERTFKRTGEVSLRTSACRLLEKNEADEEVVLADKERDVTATVQYLLGLTIDDFTRAVVLPQGKFAEFLSLKGVERRQMLQRLFHLEQYGDRLNSKLKQRVDHAVSELEKVLAEQQGLGEASLESLAILARKVEEAQLLVAERKAKLKQLEETYEQKKQIWQWQAELRHVQQKLEQLTQEAAAIQQIEEKLKLAQEAAQLKPYAEELQRAQTEVNDWRIREEHLQKEVQACQKQFQESSTRYEAAQQSRIAEEPQLIARQEQLKQAEKIEQDVGQIAAELSKLRTSLQQLEHESKIQEASLSKEQALYEKALAKQQELKGQHAELQVSSELRIKIRRANEAKQGINNQQGKREELDIELNKQAELLQQEQAKGEELARRAQLLEEHLGEHVVQVNQLYEETKLLAERLEELCSELGQEIEREQEAAERERQQELAYHLVHTLRAGEPCPVCGSMEHPQPNQREQSPAAEKRSNRIKHLEEALQQGRTAQYDLARYTYQLGQIGEAIKEGAPTLERAEKTKEGVLVLNRTDQTNQKQNSLTKGERVEDLLAPLLTACQTGQQVLQEVENEIKRDLRQWRELDREQREQAQVVRALEQEVEGLKKRSKELDEFTRKELALWQQTYSTFYFETIEAEQTKVDERDQQVAELAKRIETSITFISEREQSIQVLQHKLNQLHVKKVELGTRCSQLEEHQLRLQNQLMEYVGGQGQVKELMNQVQARLQELTSTEQIFYAQFQEYQQAYQRKEKEYSIALESLNQANQRLQQASSKWQGHSLGSSFSELEAVFKALISKDELVMLSNKVTRYREEEQQSLQEKLRLIGLLQGEQLTLVEWQELQAKLEQAKQERDESLQLVAKAIRDLEEMQAKHTRYQELEQRRLELAEKKEQLSKLSAVFRGNSFVEYVATEQLIEVSRDASYRLGQLTRQRYALEVDSGLGFVIRDDHNGGFKRPITSLSGGETFLTSLALALALSAQIQLRGEYPLEFFFLDEGFGTLDQDLLDTVISALEKLHTDHLSVGVISHVPELRARLPRQLIVQPESTGEGTTVRMIT